MDWTKSVVSVDDFVLSQDGMLLLNAVCMKLIVIGEAVKNIDRRTDKALLLKYSDTEWKEIMKLRDIIVHHYANVDAERIFAIISNDIGPLLETVKKIKNDLLKQ